MQELMGLGTAIEYHSLSGFLWVVIHCILRSNQKIKLTFVSLLDFQNIVLWCGGGNDLSKERNIY